MNLSDLGWGPEWEAAFAAHRERGLLPGRVALEDKHAFVVIDGSNEWSAIVPGRMLHHAEGRSALPKVGDWVAVRSLPEAGKGVIEAVLPRRTQLVRKMAGRDVDEQVLVSNIDTALVVMGLDLSFNLRRLERFLVMVHQGGARIVVVLNKSDLCVDPEARVAETQPVAAGAPVLAVSAQTGSGVEQLHNFIRPAETVVFIGSSGVGKSSLINRLYGEEIQATVEVRKSDAKGRHTTSWREMVRLPGGGWVIDTPGMREFHMWVAGEGVEEAFPDIEALAVGCHFRSCSHTTEKRCAVLAAVTEGRLARERFESYLKLKGELEYLAEERRKHGYDARRAGRVQHGRRWDRRAQGGRTEE